MDPLTPSLRAVVPREPRRCSVRVDGILLVGDIGPDVPWRKRGTPGATARQIQGIETVLSALRALGPPVLWVPGNHDPMDPGLAGNIDGRVETVQGLRIAGIGGAGPAKFGFPYEWDEDTIRQLELPPCDILVSHTPPIHTRLDMVAHNGFNAGSAAIREKALAHAGVLVCGHIHEAAGAERLDDCLCMNVGGLGEPYGHAQVGYVTVTRTGDRLSYALRLVDLINHRVQAWAHTVAAG